MAWIIASVPFWLLGGACLLAVGWGVKELVTDTDDRQTVPAMLLLLVLAGIVFLIAAKIAS